MDDDPQLRQLPIVTDSTAPDDHRCPYCSPLGDALRDVLRREMPV